MIPPARIVKISVGVLLILIIALFVAVSVVYITKTMSTYTISWEVISISIITVCPILFGLLGITFKGPINKLERELFEFFESRLTKLYEE